MNILIVDDHSLYREALEMLLLPLTDIETVYHAESGAQAMSALQEHEDIALVLLDYNLDDGLGIDVLLRIRAKYALLPIAIISADTQPDKIRECLDAGANGYIPKKLKSAEIGQAVTQILTGDAYIPKEAIKDLGQQKPVVPVADVARSIINQENLSIRIEPDEATHDDVTSAFNSLLDHLENKQKKLEEMAFKDELTGLFNRRYFLEQLDEFEKRRKYDQTNFALVYIDLDYFKDINDQYGHHIGDELLKAMAQRIGASARTSDLAARIGGDEFTLLLSNIDSERGVITTLSRLTRNLRHPLTIDNIELSPSASIGAALSQDNIELKQLMKQADDALYKVKEKGRNDFEIYANSMKKR